ncbi:MAG TPA: hypothetical protein VK678_02650, partial [Bradyrhizobium sp.]|nr:hypothetical protein [Bradyrhizobium sp.]
SFALFNEKRAAWSESAGTNAADLEGNSQADIEDRLARLLRTCSASLAAIATAKNVGFACPDVGNTALPAS